MLATVLIVVTLGHADAPHVSFSAAADAAECAAKSETVTGMLAGAGYQIAAARCIQTDLRFAPYDHGATDMDAAYRITLPAEPEAGGTVEPLPRLSACTPAPDADPAVHCAISAQQVVAE